MEEGTKQALTSKGGFIEKRRCIYVSVLAHVSAREPSRNKHQEVKQKLIRRNKMWDNQEH